MDIGDGKRITLVGRTGSGKTVAGLYQLALSPFDQKPFIIVDFKGDKHIRQIQGAKPLGINSPLPTEPGIYVVRMWPGQERELDALMERVKIRGNIGLYLDEGGGIGPWPRISHSYRGLLTQGRSLGVDVITLTQRPACIDTYCFSEATFIQIFDLSLLKDKKTIFEHTGVDIGDEIPPFHSIWRDTEKKTSTPLAPVPPPLEVLEIFRKRMETVETDEGETRPRRIAL